MGDRGVRLSSPNTCRTFNRDWRQTQRPMYGSEEEGKGYPSSDRRLRRSPLWMRRSSRVSSAPWQSRGPGCSSRKAPPFSDSRTVRAGFFIGRTPTPRFWSVQGGQPASVHRSCLVDRSLDDIGHRLVQRLRHDDHIDREAQAQPRMGHGPFVILGNVTPTADGYRATRVHWSAFGEKTDSIPMRPRNATTKTSRALVRLPDWLAAMNTDWSSRKG